ncbi:hypothetical protein JY96_05905 [Aquabacterium sp. NJ1]|nr:hypothetical protein JY96_05905 [Aquabacterium sp. NJ1]
MCLAAWLSTSALVSAADAATVTDAGIALNGQCIFGTCSGLSPAGPGGSAPLNTGGNSQNIVLPNKDKYRLDVWSNNVAGAGATDMRNWGFALIYDGQDDGTTFGNSKLSQADHVDLSFYQAFASNTGITVGTPITSYISTRGPNGDTPSRVDASFTDVLSGLVVAVKNDLSRLRTEPTSVSYALTSQNGEAVSKMSFSIDMAAGSYMGTGFNVMAIPEPGEASMFLLGTLGMFAAVRRQRAR